LFSSDTSIFLNFLKSPLPYCRYRSETGYVRRFNARRVLLEELIFPGIKFNEDEEILAGTCAWSGLKMEKGGTLFMG
jgi:hypothetical protein